MFNAIFSRFWSWYDRHYRLNLAIATGLFFLQIIHLTWLALHVIAFRLTGASLLPTNALWTMALIFVDYTEIPALLTAFVLYVGELRKKFRWSVIALTVFVNIQWLHLFWITDEFVIGLFIDGKQGTVLPAWLAWAAIAIDYLEVPVIVDTFIKLVASLREGKFFAAFCGRRRPWRL